MRQSLSIGNEQRQRACVPLGLATPAAQKFPAVQAVGVHTRARTHACERVVVQQALSSACERTGRGARASRAEGTGRACCAHRTTESIAVSPKRAWRPVELLNGSVQKKKVMQGRAMLRAYRWPSG